MSRICGQLSAVVSLTLFVASLARVSNFIDCRNEFPAGFLY